MPQLKVVVAIVAVVCLAAPSAFAHHPFADEFDRSQSITLNGTLTRIEWQNPHVYAYVDVRDTEGKVVNWKVEMGSPDALTKEGWTRTSVKPGEQVTIRAWRAKDNSTLANAESFTLADGKKMATASSAFMPETEMARTGQRQAGQQQAEQQPSGQQRADDPTAGTTGTAEEALPATASPLTLYGLLGALALGSALGLRRMRR